MKINEFITSSDKNTVCWKEKLISSSQVSETEHLTNTLMKFTIDPSLRIRGPEILHNTGNAKRSFLIRSLY